jgi:hypothetical protein
MTCRTDRVGGHGGCVIIVCKETECFAPGYRSEDRNNKNAFDSDGMKAKGLLGASRIWYDIIWANAS